MFDFLKSIFRRVNVRLTAVVFLVIILPSAILIGLVAKELKRDFRIALLKELSHEVSLETETATNNLNNATNDLKLCNTNIERLLRSYSGDSSSVKAFSFQMKEMLKKNNNYLRARIVLPDGDELIRLGRNGSEIKRDKVSASNNKSHRRYFQHMLKQNNKHVHVTPVSLNKEESEITLPYTPMLRIGQKINYPDGKLFGILIMNIDPNMVFGMLEKREGAKLMVVDESGQYLYHKNKDMLFGKDLAHGANIFADYKELEKDFKLKAEGSKFNKETEEYLAWKKIYYDKHSTSLFWAFLEQRSEASAISEWMSIADRGRNLILLLLAGGFGLFILITHQTLKPIRALSRALAKLGRGKLSTRVDISSQTELGLIVRSFNSMAEKLEKTNHKLRYSVALHKAISEITPNAHVVADRDGIIISVNRGAEKTFGYEPDELIGKNVSIFTPKPHRDKHDQYLKRYLETKVPKIIGKQVDNFGVRKNGELFPATVFIDEVLVGDEIFFAAIIKDVTIQKETEERLRLSQFSIDNAAESSFWVSSDGSFKYVNKKICELLEYEQEELLQLSVFDIDDAFTWDSWKQHWRELKGEKSFTLEANLKTKSKKLIPVEITVNYLEYHGVEYNCASARDMTKRKEAEKGMERAMMLAEKANKEKSMLLASTNHELRTPMQSILGLLQLVDDGKYSDEEELKKFVGDSLVSAQHLNSLIKDLSMLTVIDSDRRGPRMVNYPLRDILEKTKQVVGIQAKEKNLDLDTDCACNTKVKDIYCDPNQLREVLVNLVGNAIKFTDEGGITITCEVSDEDGSAKILVTDTGIGLPTDFDGKDIFSPFVRIDDNPERGGTGLGLSVAKRLVEGMGGKISCSSKGEGKGATFTINIPPQPKS